MADTPCCAIGKLGLELRARVDDALRALGTSGAASLGVIAGWAGCSKGTLSKHRTGCLGLTALAAGAPAEASETPGKREAETGAAPLETAGNAAGNGQETPRSPFAVPNPGDDALTAPRKVIAATVERMAVDLRVKGKSYVEIAEALDISPDAAMDAVERVLVRTRGKADEQAEAARQIDLERINRLVASLWDRATGAAADNDEADVQNRTIAQLAKLLERRAKLLGLDAPTSTTTINVFASPDWQKLRDVILDALIPFPDALGAVIQAIEAAQRSGA